MIKQKYLIPNVSQSLQFIFLCLLQFVLIFSSLTHSDCTMIFKRCLKLNF